MMMRENRNKIDYRKMDSMIIEVVKLAKAKSMITATISIPTVASKLGISSKVASIMLEDRASQMRYRTQTMGTAMLIKW